MGMEKAERDHLAETLQSSIIQLCKNAMKGCKFLCTGVEIDGVLCINIKNCEVPVVVKVHQTVDRVSGDESTDTADETVPVRRPRKRKPKRKGGNRPKMVKVKPVSAANGTAKDAPEIFDCDCGTTLTSFEVYKAHNWQEHQLSTCGICMCTFESPELLNEHTASQCFRHQPLEDSSNVKCGVCDVVSENTEHMIQHLQEAHLFSKLVHCSLCNIYFPDLKSLNDHKVSTHASNENINQDHGMNAVANISNSQTGEISITIKSGKIDPPPQRTTSPPQADVPQQLTPSAGAIVFQPEKDKKMAVNISDSDQILFKCPLCHSLEQSVSAYRDHQLTAHNRLVCHICYHSFCNQKKLHRHFNIHLRQMPFSCSECSLRFRMKEELDQHVDAKVC